VCIASGLEIYYPKLKAYVGIALGGPIPIDSHSRKNIAMGSSSPGITKRGRRSQSKFRRKARPALRHAYAVTPPDTGGVELTKLVSATERLHFLRTIYMSVRIQFMHKQHRIHLLLFRIDSWLCG